MLCAAILNACVMSSVDLLAKPTTVKKHQLKTIVKPSNNEKSDSAQEESNTVTDIKKPTLQETWQKVKNFVFKSLTRDDYWNLGKSAVGALSAVAVVYLLFRSKPANDNNRNNVTGPHMPMDQPTIIPETLQNTINNDKEIDQTSNPLTENIKALIDHHDKALQNNLEKKDIIIPASNTRKIILLCHRFVRRFFQVFIDQCIKKYNRNGQVEFEVIEDWDRQTAQEILAGYTYDQLIIGGMLLGRSNTGQADLAKELHELSKGRCCWVFVKNQADNDFAPDLSPHSQMQGKPWQPQWIYSSNPREDNPVLLKKENLELFNKTE